MTRSGTEQLRRTRFTVERSTIYCRRRGRLSSDLLLPKARGSKAVVPRTFEFGATLEILMKDVDLAIEPCGDLGVPVNTGL